MCRAWVESVAVAAAARAGVLAGLVHQQRREEAVLLRVLVEGEGEAVAGRRALVAVGALAEAAADAGGHRVLAQVRGGQAVGEVLGVLRVGAQADASTPCRATIEPSDRLQLHLGEAEVGRAVRHHRVLPGELRRVEEGEVHRPLRRRSRRRRRT